MWCALKRGEVVSTKTYNGLAVLKWHDKRDVMMLSTYHRDEMVTKRRQLRAAEGGVSKDEPVCVSLMEWWMLKLM